MSRILAGFCPRFKFPSLQLGRGDEKYYVWLDFQRIRNSVVHFSVQLLEIFS